jgi:hypothetical protein
VEKVHLNFHFVVGLLRCSIFNRLRKNLFSVEKHANFPANLRVNFQMHGFFSILLSEFFKKAKLSRTACAVANGLSAPRPRPDILDGAGARTGQRRHAGFAERRLDRARSRPEFVTAMIEDLRWFGFEWQEGPDCPDRSGFGPYNQSERTHIYRAALERLCHGGFV